MARTRSRTTVIGFAMIALAVVGGLMVRGCDASGASGAFGPPEGTLSVADARAALDRIVSTGAIQAPKYDRKAFGRPWTDVDRNGCDTRNDILARDAVRSGGTVDRSGTCTVIAIRMVEPYAGKDITRTTDVDIDHVVPLSVAWRSGAYTWPPETRLALANDPRNLLAVDDSTNQHDKGDKTPDAWQPQASARCVYARMYVTVLDAYRLPATAATRGTLASTLGGC